MSSLAQFCYQRRWFVVIGWIVLLVGLAGAAIGAGSGFTTVADLPDSESSQAYELLAEAGMSSDTSAGAVVWRSDDQPVDSPAVQAEVDALLADIAALPGVESVVSPYQPEGAGQLNASAATAFASVSATDDVVVDDIRAVVEAHQSATLDVAAGGQAFNELPEPSHGTEAIGVIAALAILAFVFRSAWASVLPILTGLVGVGTGLLGVLLISHVVDLDSTSLTMGALVGLGVGIDYALFIVNRYRAALLDGVPVPQAIAQAVNTSGRAVVFAGLTVAVALLAIAVVGLGVLTGMGQAAAVTVLGTVLTAITLLPALLGLLGTRVLSKKQRAALASREVTELVSARPSLWGRWSGVLLRAPRRVVAAVLVVLAVLALPVTSMRVGSADASSDPEGTPTREYYDLMAPAFGEGVDATLVLAAETPDAEAARAFEELAAALPEVAGVASVQAAPVQPGQPVAVATVVPSSSAQTEETANLVAELREEVIPAVAGGTSLEVHVGGETATNIDIGDALMSKLPVYLGMIAVLGFLLLAVAFRSVLVPLVGALTNLLTLLVGLGAITAIYQLGWGSQLLGVGSGAPVFYIVPVIVVGVVFGLAMDYQVFLVSRMHEEWTRHRDNTRAVRVGVSETGRVIATAAAIMLAVFASFGFTPDRIISSIGIGLAVAVLVDALLVRLTLVPALMRLIGRHNWSYPRWADRITPRVSVEGPAEVTVELPERELVPAGARQE